MASNFVLIALGSAVFAAAANILARTLLRNLKAEKMLSINFAVMAVTLFVVSPFFYQFTPSAQTIGLVLLIGLIDAAANFFYFKTFEKTEASVATPILSLAPGFTFLFSWLFLGEVVSLRVLLLAITIIVAIIVFSTDFKNFKHFRATSLVPALSASFLYGISAIPSKELLTQTDAINAPTLFMFRAALISVLAFIFFKGVSLKNLSSGQYRLIFLRGLFVAAQWILLYYALSLGSAGVAVTLANTTPIFVFAFGALFLAERPTLKKIIAALLVVALILLI